MEIRFQHILLIAGAAFLFLAMLFQPALAGDSVAKTSNRSVNINDEVFELGVTLGVINIADFGSEYVTGLNTTFRASENFFLQFNLLTAEASLSSYEENQGRYFSGDDRTYSHYNLLLGYNIFQGEVFGSKARASLSSLYLIGGVGDTEFGGETAFTYVYGIGYQMALGRRYVLRFDNRNYIYRSSLIKEDEDVHNSQLSAGIGFLF